MNMKKIASILFVASVLFFSMPAMAYAHTSLQVALILSIIFFLPAMLCFAMAAYIIGSKLHEFSPHIKQAEYKFSRQFIIIVISSLLYPVLYIINGILAGVIVGHLFLEYIVVFGIFFLASFSVLLISLFITNKLTTQRSRPSGYASTFAIIGFCGIIIVELVYVILEWYYRVVSKIISWYYL